MSAIDQTQEKVNGKKPLILISGASGFVAAHILNSFLKRGYNVRGTVRSEATAEKVKKSHSKYMSQLEFAIVPDVATSNAFDEAVKGVDGVVHTASPFVLQVMDNEKDLLIPATKGTTEMLAAVQKNAPQVTRIVVTSSFAAIIDMSKGARPGYTYSEKEWNPVTYEEAKSGSGVVAYCASKTFAERAAHEFVEKKKPNFTISTICLPMIYGPVEQGSASLKHLNTSAADIYRFMDGSQKEPGATGTPAFVHVHDVAEAHLKAFEHSDPGRYLLAAGNFQYTEVCAIIKKALPSIQNKVPGPSKTAPAECFKVDNSKAERELGIKFRSLEETITDTAKRLARLQAISA